MNERVRDEQLRMLYNNLPLALLPSLVAATVFVLLMYQLVARAPLLTWYAITIVMIAWRGWQYHQYRASPSNPRKLHLQTVIYSTLFGLCWGWLPIAYLSPDNVLMLSHVSLFIIAMTAGAMVTQTVFLPSYIAFHIPIGLASTLAIALKSGDYAYLAWLAALMNVVAFIFALKVHQMLQNVIATRLEKEALVQALANEKQQAEEANKAKSQFLAAVSHDVRQPMHALTLYMNMLEADPGNKEIIRRMSDALASLDDLYSRMLEISQLDAGSVKIISAPISLNLVVEHLVERHQEAAHKKGLVIEFADTRSLWVYTDEVLLNRVLDNLLSNAIKYTDTGAVTIDLACSEHKVMLTISDTGIGIDADEVEAIFQEYYQVGNAARDRDQGLGLGLAIVKRLSDMLDLDLKVASQLNQGSAFSMSLTRCSAPHEESFAELQTSDLSGTHILLVEDDTVVREAVVGLLKHWQCHVDWVAASNQIEQLAEQPDLILADFRLADGDTGLTTIKLVRDRFTAEIPAVVITGDTSAEIIQNMERSGYPVLYKPVRADRLRATIQAALKETA